MTILERVLIVSAFIRLRDFSTMASAFADCEAAPEEEEGEPEGADEDG